MLMSLPVHETTNTPVTQLMLYVTEECNLRCTYCFVDKQPRHMTHAKARQAVDFFLRSDVSGNAPALLINFFGGEPFLKPDVMLETIRYARQQAGGRIRFAATTNGTIATPQTEQAISEGQMVLLISVDGDVDSHRHRPTVSGANSYGHVERKLQKLLAWAPDSVIRMTYHPASFNLLDKVIAAAQLGAPWITLCPVPEADWHGCEQRLDQESVRLADWFIAEFEAGRIPPLEMHWRFLADLLVRQGRPGKACGLATTLLSIDTAGNVLPCHRYIHHKQEHLGSVLRNTRFTERRAPYVHLPRAETAECPTCLANTVCGGGCRVIAQEAGYGIRGVHPNHCLLTRAHVRQVQRIAVHLRECSRFQDILQHYLDSEVPYVA